MKTVSFAPLSVAPLLWEAAGGEWSLTVVAKATLWLVHGGEATLADEQQPLSRDRHFNDDSSASLYSPSDWAPIKARADVLLVGHAYAPEGRKAPSLVARVEVGSFSKEVTAFGDRVWQKGPNGLTPSAAAPFAKMPLSYELAARTLDNPVGIRATGQIVLGAAALPNLEAGSDGVACFGPISSSWRSRRALLTDAGHRWSERLAGPPPHGFDYAFFNAAPPDQQVELLRMGSTIRLTHLHADLAVFETRLPAMRPRAYVITPGAGVREVMLRCDTLWLDPDHEGATVTWRGLGAVDARDIVHGLVAVVLESKVDPHPFRHVEPLVSLDASGLARLAGLRDAFTLDEQSSNLWEPDTTTSIRALAPRDLQRAEPDQGNKRLTQGLTVDALRARMRASQQPEAGRAREPDASGLEDNEGEARTLDKVTPRVVRGGPLQLGGSPLGGGSLGGDDDRADTVAMTAMKRPAIASEVLQKKEIARDEITSDERPIDDPTQDAPTYAGLSPDDADDDAIADVDFATGGPIPLERYAAISAEIAVRKRPVAEVIGPRGVSQAEWQTSDKHYRSLFSKGSGVGAFDRAYIASLDKLRAAGPITVSDYARIVAAVERGEVAGVAALLELSHADLMRVQRVWARRVMDDPALRRAFEADLRVAKG